MWTDFLIFGGVAFWIFAAIVAAFLIFAMESTTDSREDTGGGFAATIIVVLTLVLYYFFGSNEHINSLFKFIFNQFWLFFGFTVLYLAVGVVWSFFKWFFFLRQRRDYLQLYGKFKQDEIPLAKNNKNRISTWITFWPFSGLWTLINDPIRKAVSFIVDSFSGWYDRMSKSAFEGYVKPKENK